jgi:hypothetical protein
MHTRPTLLLLLLFPLLATAAPRWSGPPLVAATLDGGAAIHGVAGDQVLLFALVPSASPDRSPGVYVRRRLDGGPAGTLTAPPGGWGVPLSMKITTFERIGVRNTYGEALILDNRVPPALAGTQPARIYRYRYLYTVHGGLTSQLVSSHALPINTVAPGAGLPDGLIYPGSIALLPDGEVVVTDNIAGALWVSDSLDDWRLAAIDPRWAGAPSGPVQGVGLAQSGNIEPYTLLVPAPPGFPPGVGLYPGAHSITYASISDEVIWAVTLPGGIYAMPLSVLLDTAIPPFAKSGDPAAGIADHSEHAVLGHIEAGKQAIEEQRQHLLDRQVALPAPGQAHEALDRRGDRDQALDVLVVPLPPQIEDHAEAEVGDEGERVRRVDRDRRENREQALHEVSLEPLALPPVEIAGSENRNVRGVQLGPQLLPAALLALDQRRHPLVDQDQLLGRVVAVRAPGPLPGAQLSLESGDPDHRELFQIARRDRQKTEPFEQRIALVVGLLEDALVEGEPRQLAIEKAFRRRRGILRGAGHDVLRC